MVKAVTSFGRSGLSDWLVQRVSGVILLAFALVSGYIGAAGRSAGVPAAVALQHNAARALWEIRLRALVPMLPHLLRLFLTQQLSPLRSLGTLRKQHFGA